jgi:hypothetical protein
MACAFSERLLIGRDRVFGLAPELIGGFQIALDLRRALVDYATDPRQHHPHHQQIQNGEGDREPDDLWRPIERIELRHRRVLKTEPRGSN